MHITLRSMSIYFCDPSSISPHDKLIQRHLKKKTKLPKPKLLKSIEF